MRVEEVLKRLNINPVSFDERKALINLSTTEIKLLEAIHKPLYAYENELIVSALKSAPLQNYDLA